LDAVTAIRLDIQIYGWQGINAVTASLKVNHTMKGRVFGKAQVCVFVSLASFALYTPANSATINDNYWGGVNTYSGFPGAPGGSNGDVIGAAGTFDISSVSVQRIQTGATTNDLKIVINTNYAGVPGTSAADGTGYGAVFFKSGGIGGIPTGAASNADVYTPGKFDYAFAFPSQPGSGNQSGTAAAGSTTGGLFALQTGAGAGSDVVLSSGGGHSVTYPTDPSSPFYFRQGQAVGFDNVSDEGSIDGGTWTVDSLAKTITILIKGEDGLLGSTLALEWAMTCGNDVVLGNVTPELVPCANCAPPPGETPLPAALPLFASGLGFLGYAARRRRRSKTATL
jgi:hypothetical protein